MTGWVIHCRGIDWECSTEQDALGVLVYLRDYGRQPMGPITIEGSPNAAIAELAAAFAPTLPQPMLL